MPVGVKDNANTIKEGENASTTIKEEVLQEVLQWQDVKVKEEETEEEMSDRELGLRQMDQVIIIIMNKIK